MTDFRLKDARSDAEFCVEEIIGPLEYEPWTYVVSYRSQFLTATSRIEDYNPQCWTQLFRDMARHWQGWSGVKECSADGALHLRIGASSDGLGHVELKISFGGPEHQSAWRAEVTLHLEAGQLGAIAVAAAQAFGTKHSWGGPSIDA